MGSARPDTWVSGNTLRRRRVAYTQGLADFSAAYPFTYWHMRRVLINNLLQHGKEQLPKYYPFFV